MPYAFDQGRVEGDNGSKGILYEVSMDFHQQLETRESGTRVVVELGNGELRITGMAKRLVMTDGVMPESGQVYFQTVTSNFGVAKKFTIKLNNCVFDGLAFEAHADRHGNVFTLSTEE